MAHGEAAQTDLRRSGPRAREDADVSHGHRGDLPKAAHERSSTAVLELLVVLVGQARDRLVEQDHLHSGGPRLSVFGGDSGRREP